MSTVGSLQNLLRLLLLLLLFLLLLLLLLVLSILWYGYGHPAAQLDLSTIIPPRPHCTRVLVPEYQCWSANSTRVLVLDRQYQSTGTRVLVLILQYTAPVRRIFWGCTHKSAIWSPKRISYGGLCSGGGGGKSGYHTYFVICLILYGSFISSWISKLDYMHHAFIYRSSIIHPTAQKLTLTPADIDFRSFLSRKSARGLFRLYNLAIYIYICLFVISLYIYMYIYIYIYIQSGPRHSHFERFSLQGFVSAPGQ